MLVGVDELNGLGVGEDFEEAGGSAGGGAEVAAFGMCGCAGVEPGIGFACDRGVAGVGVECGRGDIVRGGAGDEC